MNLDMIFDAHTHFNDRSYSQENFNLQQLIQEAEAVGVGYFLNCAFDVDSAVLAIAQANKYNNLFVAVGIHPMDVHKCRHQDLQQIERLAQNPKVVAIGEVGLDYYWKNDNHAEQIAWFKNQKALAKKYNLTLMMHIRDAKDNFQAYDDILKILAEDPVDRMIVHCFSANWHYAQKFLALGCYLNIGGAVTFKNAKDLQAAVQKIPLERILVETDAPYLTPHPFRGQKNFPKLITYTVAKIAALKGITVAETVRQTTANAFKVFQIKK